MTLHDFYALKFLYNVAKISDLQPNPFCLKSTSYPPAGREPALDIYIDIIERDIMTAKPTRIRDNLTRRERQLLRKLQRRTEIITKPAADKWFVTVINGQNYLDEINATDNLSITTVL